MRGSVVPEVKPAASLGNEKKGKKGCSKKMERKDDGDDLGDRVVPVIRFGGKFKTKKKRSGNSSLFSAFGLLGEDEDGDDHESKENDDGGLCVPAISFSGKEKPSKSKKSGAFELLEDGTSISKVGDDSGEGGADDPEEGILAVRFSGKNKSSTDTGIGDAPSGIVETDQHGGDSKDKKPNGEEVASKNSRKKKKGGNNLQEDEDDLDKLLAEFGAVPSVLKPVQVSAEAPVAPPRGENLQNKPEQEEAEEEVLAVPVMSKKKKKKKEKEKKTSNSAAEEAKNEINSKTAGKKVPKHIREMQEKLAKLKEAVERKKREEEERFRKEEEERLKQEELERLAEEKRRLKKEKEKEKLLKKKQEGKLLTGKQKEEARRLESMKKQILANANLDLSSGDSSGPPAKRPRYQKKKLNRQSPSNGADSKEIHHDAALELDSVEPWEVELSSEQDKAQLNDAVEDYGVGDVEDWDSKSWDDDLKFPGRIVFADEEVDSEPGPLTKKDLKNTGSASVDSVLKAPNETAVAAPEMPPTPENVDVQTNKSKPDDNPFQNEQNLRSPICCIMGHVNAGKTQLLDCIRGTKVQEGEAGGITQQIGATYFPAENIRGRTRELKADAKLNVPGLLVIDTPGHESFTNLRSRGSGLCDLAILVVDIMHGLEPQTIESLNLLKMRNTDFIIALNKVDRLYGWKTCRNAPIGKAIEQQTEEVKIEFKWRLTEIITQFKEQGLNTQLYYKNKEWGETYNIVPTSAISGDGVPDLLLLLVQWAQKTMVKRLTYSEKVQCTVLEVKVIEGHGTTIDVVLVNGVLHEGDQIVVCGMQGPVVTTIRALLTPHPMRELRVKGTYLLHKEIKAAQGIKIAAQGLEHTIAGSSLYVVGPHDDVEDIKEVAMEDVESVIRIDKSGEGVYVQASTLGSLEALLGFLKTPAANIPVSAISIGPVHKKDVRKASFMLEKKREYGTILAFDVKVTPEAQELADKLHVKILRADIIYHLFDKFKAHRDDLKGKKKRETAEEPVFPCVLRINPDGVFHKKYPIVLGVDVIEGIAKIGTPLCVPQKGFIDIGRIASIQNNHKSVDYAKKGQQVAIKIIGNNPEEQQKMFGRHFEMEDRLVSKISRRSLDAINDKDDLSPEDIQLLFELKEEFGIT